MIQPLQARPEYLARFQSDPFRRPEVDGCGTCHINKQGGGPRNEFGTAFEKGDHAFTPMLRASFPDRFKFDTSKVPNGGVFYFSDPEGKSVVYEKDQQKTLIDLVALTVVKADTAPPLPAAENRMTFFVTSKATSNGEHFGGLAGADRYCQSLAQAVNAGDRTWRAYLSTSFEGQPAVNAGDRIGSGPWFNAKGVMVARGPADLVVGARMTKENLLNEKGEPADDVDVLTGSQANGTAAIDMNCNNWTSNAAQNKAMAGHPGDSWNSGHPVTSCSQPGLFYCFALH
jgi:hypothetical protein